MANSKISRQGIAYPQKYRLVNGSLSPSLCLKASKASSVASSPKIVRAGSPGGTFIAQNNYRDGKKCY